MSRRRLSVAALVLLVAVLGAGAAVGGYLVTDHLRPRPAPTKPAPTPSAYAAAGATPRAEPTASAGPAASASGVTRALAPLLRAPGLGPRVRAEVLDGADGTVLLNRSGSAPAAPASTAKLLTAAAVLAVRPATYRITTTVRRGTGGAVVLLGAGDPTLTGAAAGSAG